MCCNEDVILRCFGCQGNSTTLGSGPQELGLDVREELKKFHSLHYSANLMRLTVIGRGGGVLWSHDTHVTVM